MDLKKKILSMFESEEMKKCIESEYDSLNCLTKADIIKGARIHIRKKLEALEQLYKEECGDSFQEDEFGGYELKELKSDINEYRRAVEQIDAAFGDVYIVGEYGFDHAAQCVKLYGYYPYTSFYKAIQYITPELNKTKEERIGNEIPQFWYTIEKYSADSENNMNEVIRWFIMPDGTPTGFNGAGCLHDLNIPHPFSDGDIVVMDCTPNLPPRVGVIIETGLNPNDCCMPQVLYVTKDGNFETGALKHGNVFKDYNCRTPYFSPMYSLKSFNGQLSGNEKILHNVSLALKQSNKKVYPTLGNILWRNIHDADTNNCGIPLETLNELLKTSVNEYSSDECPSNEFAG